VLIKLGQDYLPSRPGTAAGVTLGLAVSIGGLIAPLFGLVAEHHGPQGVLTVLCALPVLAALLSRLLSDPEHVRGRRSSRPATEQHGPITTR
jgi:MFS transporter, FSR family, fosmidomycin resistance protein